MTATRSAREAPPEALPWIAPEQCEGCADCAQACPPGVLVMCEGAHEGFAHPWILAVDGCTGCGRCERACVWGAIQLTAYVEEALDRLRTRGPATAASSGR